MSVGLDDSDDEGLIIPSFTMTRDSVVCGSHGRVLRTISNLEESESLKVQRSVFEAVSGALENPLARNEFPRREAIIWQEH